MKWFERHLNWTTILAAILGLGMQIVVALVCFAFSRFIFWNPIPSEFVIYYGFASCFTFLIQITLTLWVVTKKQLQLWFIFPYLFVICIPSIWFIRYFFYWDLDPPLFIFISYLLFIISLILILVGKENLNDKSKYLQSIFVVKIKWNQIIVSTIRISLILVILVSGFSYYRIKMNTQTIVGYNNQIIKFITSYTLDDLLNYRYFSFELPNYYVNDWTNYDENENHYSYTRDIFSFTNDLYLSWDSADALSVWVEKAGNNSPSLQQVIDEAYPVEIPPYSRDYFPTDIADRSSLNITTINIDGRIGEYTTFLAYPRWNADLLYRVYLVQFGKDEEIWTIELKINNPNASSKVFDTLIKTFKISG